MLAIFFFGISVNKNSHIEEAEKEIVKITEIYAQNYNDNVTENVPQDIRVTVIDSSFKVVADSGDEAVVGTYHTNREEIEAALGGNPKVVTRYSDSLKKDMVYYALKVDRGGDYVFIRTAIPVESVSAYATKTIPTMVYVLIVALTVSVVLSIVAANGLIKPLKQVKKSISAINDGEFKPVLAKTGDSDINELISEINDVGEKLQKSIKAETEDREKLSFIINNVSDGIVVLKDKKIELINKNALSVFKIKDAAGNGYEILSSDKDFLENVAAATDGAEKSFSMNAGGKDYLVSAAPLDKGFTAIVLSDITAVVKNERMRGEFFANASHELKTPLTAIKGFNDIIGMQTSEEKIKSLSAKIDKETTRIINLINDMLNLSRLEAETVISPEKLSLKEIANEVKESLSPIAEQKKVTVKVDGDGMVEMEKEHAVELVKNLTENGIRYNEAGGHVEIKITEVNGKTTLSVKDDGIGIEEEHLSRIFERFYRVNKSRSRETGGTGLGLSIVKHVCSLYGAEVAVKSKFGSGTTVTVTFRN